MSRAEFASRSEDSPTFQYETAVRPEIYAMPDTLPGETGFSAEAASSFEELPQVEASKSEVSFRSEASSALEETAVSAAFPGPGDPRSLECSVSEVEAQGGSSLKEDISREAAQPLWEDEPFFQAEERPLSALELLPGLHDPFAEVEAKLARLSSTVAGVDGPQVDVPKVTTQVAEVAPDARQWCGGAAGGGEIAGPARPPQRQQHSLWAGSGVGAAGKEQRCRLLCRSVGRLGSRSQGRPGGHLFRRRRDTCAGSFQA